MKQKCSKHPNEFMHLTLKMFFTQRFYYIEKSAVLLVQFHRNIKRGLFKYQQSETLKNKAWKSFSNFQDQHGMNKSGRQRDMSQSFRESYRNSRMNSKLKLINSLAYYTFAHLELMQMCACMNHYDDAVDWLNIF